MNTLLSARAVNRHEIECWRNDKLAWRDGFTNVCTTEGFNKLLDAGFKTGLASPAWLIGLVDGAETPSFSAADTYGLHTGWVENEAYDEEVRQAFVPGTIAAAAVDNVESRAVFTISEDGLIAGDFITDGIVIYGEGSFTSGSRPVEEGDTLRVTVTLSLTE